MDKIPQEMNNLSKKVLSGEGIRIVNQMNSCPQEMDELDRGCLFGDGFFTTGIIQNHLFCFDQLHYDRLVNSAERLLFEPLDIILLRGTINRLCAEVDNAIIRITISRRQKSRGYAIATEANYHCCIILSELVELAVKPCVLINGNTAISVNQSLAGVKHLNRLDSVLAASEITDSRQEVLMYHGDKVICGSKSNLFVKLNGQWLTPVLDQCGIEGITRGRVLSALTNVGTQCDVKVINRSDMAHIEAAFVTNSLIGIWPAYEYDGRALNLDYVELFKTLVTRT